jgi:hypothetical protein
MVKLGGLIGRASIGAATAAHKPSLEQLLPAVTHRVVYLRDCDVAVTCERSAHGVGVRWAVCEHLKQRRCLVIKQKRLA